MTADEEAFVLKIFENPEPASRGVWYVNPAVLLRVALELQSLRTLRDLMQKTLDISQEIRTDVRRLAGKGSTELL